MLKVTLQDLKNQDNDNAFEGIVFRDGEDWFKLYLDAWREAERVCADRHGLQEAKIESDTWYVFWLHKCRGQNNP